MTSVWRDCGPLFCLIWMGALTGCEGCGETSTASGTNATGSALPVSSAEPTAEASHKAPERSGGALARSADGERLYLADEDHRTLRVLALPFAAEPAEFVDPADSGKVKPKPSASPSPSASASAAAPRRPRYNEAAPRPPIAPPPSAKSVAVEMPGAPAQVLSLDGKVLVTIRDPGMLLVLSEVPGDKLEEQARIPLAADAWGIAITPDEKMAIVTSAWTHTVSGVDLTEGKVRWTLDVAREPRGVVVHPNGKVAYVSHLTSGDLTRIDGLDGAAASATTVPFPAAPARTPLGHPLKASLGYALVIDDAGHRLLAARHALGALADRSWFGVATVDVLQTHDDTPLLKPRQVGRRVATTPAFEESRAFHVKNSAGFQSYLADQFTSPSMEARDDAQPRAMVIARKSKSIWVAYEGHDSVAQYPLYAASPTERGGNFTLLGSHYQDPRIVGNGYSETDGIPGHCGAPTGLALSADEAFLYVYCRSTNDIATLRLPNAAGEKAAQSPQVAIARLTDEPLDTPLSRGRRLFYGARDGYSSGGLACAGCHPDGRDDGHVWHEVFREKEAGVFLASEMLEDKTNEGRLGHARQTPMLAGRLGTKGPYGWQGQNKDLRERLAEGFERHRWSGHDEVDPTHWQVVERFNVLSAFLKDGLVAPPQATAELSPVERRGKEIFESDVTQCKVCHVPETEFTDRANYQMTSDPEPGFEPEENMKYRTPSLRFVGGTSPYFHDGRAASLAALVRDNRDRMGKTSHLSPEDQAALVAYLETL